MHMLMVSFKYFTTLHPFFAPFFFIIKLSIYLRHESMTHEIHAFHIEIETFIPNGLVTFENVSLMNIAEKCKKIQLSFFTENKEN